MSKLFDKLLYNLSRPPARRGLRLRGERELAEILGAHPQSIRYAMNQLADGGWIEKRRNAGCFVRRTAGNLPGRDDIPRLDIFAPAPSGEWLVESDCPLPPLEALACGCLVAGFAGFGGFDYLRQLDPGGYVPPVPLRPVPWGGNACISADHDVFGAVTGLERLSDLWRAGGPALDAALDNARATAAAYAPEVRRAALPAIWAGLRA